MKPSLALLATQIGQKLIWPFRIWLASTEVTSNEISFRWANMKRAVYNTLSKWFWFVQHVCGGLPFSRNPPLVLKQLYDNVINMKALLLNGLQSKKNKILASGDVALIQQLRSWENAKAKLSALYFQSGSEGAIAGLTAEIERLEKKLNQQSGLLRMLKPALTWQRVKATLKPGRSCCWIDSGEGLGRNEIHLHISCLCSPQWITTRGFIIQRGRGLKKKTSLTTATPSWRKPSIIFLIQKLLAAIKKSQRQ